MSEDQAETEVETAEVETPKAAKKDSGRGSKETYGAKGEQKVLMMDPEDIHIVTNPKSPIYDKRHMLPVDETMVQNVKRYGIIQNIVARKNPETGKLEAVTGRQRLKWLRAANKLLKREGEKPRDIPVRIIRGLDEMTANAYMAIENAGRIQESIQGRAEKIQHRISLDPDVSHEDLALMFNCTTQTIKNTLGFLESCPAVRKATEDGVISVAQAYKFSKLDVDEQKKLVEKAKKASGGAKTPRQKTRAVREATSGPKARGIAELKEALKDKIEFIGGDTFDEGVRAGLKWAAGGREVTRAQKTPKNGAGKPAKRKRLVGDVTEGRGPLAEDDEAETEA